MRPFNREKFLFYLLAGIFIWQGLIFSLGAWGCFHAGGLQACPALGERYENTVNLMVATTLALLTTGVVSNAVKKPGSATDSDDKPQQTTPAERFRATRE